MVSSGSATISQQGNSTTIHQTSDQVAIDWQKFDIAAHEQVEFIQPGAGALAVNKIYDTDGTRILGQLDANGQVWLINPNGIFFGRDAQVNVGALIASAVPLKDFSDPGDVLFGDVSSGRVTNDGNITAAEGGYVALLGHEVRNNGVIRAQLGSIALAGGNQIRVKFQDNALLGVQVEQNQLNALVENRQMIIADGGQVLMTAGARNSLMASAVNNTGVVQANTVQNRNGKIVLLGGLQAGVAQVAGTLKATADEGDGGFIETSAAVVSVADDAVISTRSEQGQTGTWLIDPKDYTVAASGGDITGAALGNQLAHNNVVIESVTGASDGNGDIFVNDRVSWNSSTALTLKADRNIEINKTIDAGSQGKLALKYGQADADGSYKVNAPINLPEGLNFSTQSGSAGPVLTYQVITELGAEGSTTGTDLQGINGALGGRYVLGADIDASSTASWNSGAGFLPVGFDYSNQFSGTFDGLGHTITGLTVSRSQESGLFGLASYYAAIRNLGVVNPSINSQASAFAGGLVGYSAATISNSYVSGGSVSGNNRVGGLVGISMGFVSDSYANTQVSAPGDRVGGLVGFNNEGQIIRSYSGGAVSGANVVGGLVGEHAYRSGLTIRQSYSDAQVTAAGSYAGGLVGINNGLVYESYATGSVSGGSVVGGLIGRNTRVVNGGYASGLLTSAGLKGGLIAEQSGFLVGVNYSHWNTDTTGVGVSAGGSGKTAAQMMQQSSFSNWDISAVGGSSALWRIYEGHTQPLLRSFLTPLNLSDSNFNYTGSAQTLTPNSDGVDVSLIKGVLPTGTHVGAYASNLYSVQDGYDLSGSLTISPKVVSLSGSRAFDGTTDVAALDLSINGLVGAETLLISGAGSSSNADAGAYDINLGTLALANGTGSTANYTLNGGVHSFSITPKGLQVSATAPDYFGQSQVALNYLGSTDVLAGDKVGFDYQSASYTPFGGSLNLVVTGIQLSGADALNYQLNSDVLILPVSASVVQKGSAYNIQQAQSKTERILANTLTANAVKAGFYDHTDLAEQEGEGVRLPEHLLRSAN
ncbi:MAG: filamentous hemagglutinin N-terminal domain-containing protein [Amphritea sp.]|nr:filamentous hemagglutinin N-terminal domain-containing protein [Amphritea sp.]